MIKPIPSIDIKPGSEYSRQTKPMVLTASPYKHAPETSHNKENKCLTKKRTVKVVQQIAGKKRKRSKKHKNKSIIECDTDDESSIEMILQSDGDCGNDDDVDCLFILW